MRIENGSRTGAVASRAGERGARSGAGFAVSLESAPSRPAALAPGGALAPMDALLVLQALEDATLARKRQVRRGLSLLETLDELRLDLLGGQIGEGRINRLLALIGQARLGSDPRLDGILDDVEMRARVELAKLGHFPP